jgi:hypothetical protein
MFVELNRLTRLFSLISEICIKLIKIISYLCVVYFCITLFFKLVDIILYFSFKFLFPIFAYPISCLNSLMKYFEIQMEPVNSIEESSLMKIQLIESKFDEIIRGIYRKLDKSEKDILNFQENAETNKNQMTELRKEIKELKEKIEINKIK